MWSMDELASALAMHAGQPCEAGRADDRALWNTLYESTRRHPQLQPLLQRRLAGVEEHPQAKIKAAAAAQWAGDVFRTSVTALEAHAACPFKYFAREMLKLKQRPQGRVDALQLGALYHDVLNRFTQALLAAGLTLADLSPEQLRARLEDCLAGIAGSAEPAAGTSEPREHAGPEPFLWERLRTELLDALDAQRTFQAAGSCRTIASELAFGLEEPGGLPPLQLHTPAGHTVLLRGKIDRVDLARHGGRRVGFIYDYKRSRTRALNLSEVYHGLSLQLLAYLGGLPAWSRLLANLSAGVSRAAAPDSPSIAREEAARTTAPGPNDTCDSVLVPGGAFYLPLVPDYCKVDHPDDHQDRLRRYRPRGLFDGSHLDVLDPGLQAGASSDVVAADLTQSGVLSRKQGSDGAESSNFQAALQHIARKLVVLSDAILAGDVRVAPYRMANRMPCQFCEFRPVCRFEPPGETRQLSAIKSIWKDLSA